MNEKDRMELKLLFFIAGQLTVLAGGETYSEKNKKRIVKDLEELKNQLKPLLEGRDKSVH